MADKKKLNYQFTTSDGKTQEVSADDVAKNGWGSYTKSHPNATVRMRDEDNADYDVPIDRVSAMIDAGLHPFSISHPAAAPQSATTSTATTQPKSEAKQQSTQTQTVKAQEPKQQATSKRQETKQQPQQSKVKMAKNIVRLSRDGQDYEVFASDINAAGGFGKYAAGEKNLRVYMRDPNGKRFRVLASAVRDKVQQGWQVETRVDDGKRYNPSDQKLAATQDKIKQGNEQLKLQGAAGEEAIKSQQEYMSRGGTGQTVDAGLKFNKQTGLVEHEYITPTGQRTFNKNAADQASREYRQEVKAQADYEATVGNAVNAAWDAATKADKQYADDNQYTGITIGSMPGTKSSGATLHDIDIRKHHKELFDLDKMTSSIYEGLPESYRQGQLANYKNYYTRHTNELKGRSVEQAAREALQCEVYQAVYNKAVAAKMPKSKLEFLLRKITEMQPLSNEWALEMEASKAANSYGENIARDAAMNQFGQQHQFLNILGTVGNMMLDPTTYIAGGVGSWATKNAMNAFGKYALKGATSKVAGRYAGTTLAGRLTGAAAGGAVNFGTYETLGNAEEQLAHGGVADLSAGKTEDYSVGEMLLSGAHGVIVGGLTGGVPTLLGNVGDKLTKVTSSTAGKVGVKAGTTAASALTEGTIFATVDYLNPNDDRSYMDVWDDSMAMILGFKGSHAIKSAPKAIRELKAMNESKRVSFAENLRNRMNQSPSDIAFTPSELKELETNGYGDLSRLFSKKDAPKKKSNTPLDGGIPLADMEEPKPTELDGYDMMEQLISDKRVSEAARAKAYYILTGRMLPMSTVSGYQIATAEDGSVTVASTSGDGGIVIKRTFKDISAAQGEINAIHRQAELNGVDVGEKLSNSLADQKAIELACMDVAAQMGVAPDVAFKAYEDVLKGDDNTPNAKAIADAVKEGIDRHQSDVADMRPDAKRAAVNEKYGLDVDEAFKKIDDRTPEEQQAIEEYMQSLYPEDAVRNSRPQQGNANPEREIAEQPDTDSREEAFNAVNDDVETKRADIREQVSKLTNKQTGMAHPATMKVDDRQVYIVDGNVQMMDDGTMVDKEASDKTVFVYDKETGKIESIDINDILRVDEPIDPNEIINNAEAELETEKQAAADVINDSAPESQPEQDEIEVKSKYAAGYGTMQGEDGGEYYVQLTGDTRIGGGGETEYDAFISPKEGERSGSFEWIPESKLDESYKPSKVQEPEAAPEAEQQGDAQATYAVNEDAIANADVNDINSRGGRWMVESAQQYPEFFRSSVRKSAETVAKYLNGEISRDEMLEQMSYVLENIDEAQREEYAEREVNIYNPLLDEQEREIIGNNEEENQNFPIQSTENVNSDTQEGEYVPENGNLGTQGGNNAEQNIPENIPAADVAEQPSALTRIAKDDDGEPKYTEADPETAYDAAVELLGDEQDAIEYIDSKEGESRRNLRDAEEAVGRVKPTGKTSLQFKAAKDAARAKVEEARAINEKWKAIQAVRTQRAEQKRQEEMQRQAEEQKKAIEDKRMYDEQLAAQRKAEQEAAEEQARQEALAAEQAIEDAKPENVQKRKAEDQFEQEFQAMVDEASNAPEAAAIKHRRDREDRMKAPSEYREAMDKWDAPTSLEEWVLRALAGNKNDERVRWSGEDGMAVDVFGREDASERDDLRWLTSDKNGSTMGAFVHRLAERVRQDAGQVDFNASEVSDVDVRNAAIDALRRHPKSMDLFREAAARQREREDESSEAMKTVAQLNHDHDGIRDEWYRERFGMSKEEHDAYIEQSYQQLGEVSDDELAEAQQQINNEISDYEKRTANSSKGGEVLSGQQANELGGGESTSSEGHAPTDSNGNRKNGNVPSQGSTVVSAGRDAEEMAASTDNLSKGEAAEPAVNAKLSEEQNEEGKPFVVAADGSIDFGTVEPESGLTEAPIRLSLGENRVDTAGENHGYGLLHIEASHGDQIRKAGYSSVEEFVEEVAKNYTTIREGAKIGNKQTYLLEVSDERNNTLYIQLSKDGTYWNINSAGIFRKRYSRNMPKVHDRPAVGDGKDTDTTEVNSSQTEGATAPAGNSSETSESKGNTLYLEKQADDEKSSAESTGNKVLSDNNNVLGNDRLTEIRDKALNEKGNGITVFEENEDADGNKGIRIGNKQGHTIYWLDDIIGEKGAAELDDARKQLAKHERDHANNERLSKVKDANGFLEYLKSIGEADEKRGVQGYNIKEWVNQAKTALAQERELRDVIVPMLEELNKSDRTDSGDNAPYTIESTKYTTKKGKELDVQLVKFDHDLSKAEKDKANEIAKASKGWYSREHGGWLMRDKDSAEQLAKAIAEPKQEEPLTADDYKEAAGADKPTDTDEDQPVVSRVDVNALFGDLYTNGTTKLSDHATPVEDEPQRTFKKGDEVSWNGGGHYRVVGKDNKGKYIIEDAEHKSIHNIYVNPEEIAPYAKAEEPIAEAKPEAEQPKYEVNDDELGSLMGNIRDILGIDDSEGDNGFVFKGAELTSEERAKVMSSGTRIAMALVERGVTDFDGYATKMIGAFGDKIRPWLKAFYNGARDIPGFEKYSFTPYDEVSKVDIATFGKKRVDPMEHAATVTAEEDAAAIAAAAQADIKKKRDEAKKAEEAKANEDWGLGNYEYSLKFEKDGSCKITRDDVSGAVPIGDGRFSIKANSAEEMLGILKNPANKMEGLLKYGGFEDALKKSVELERKRKGYPDPENKEAVSQWLYDNSPAISKHFSELGKLLAKDEKYKDLLAKVGDGKADDSELASHVERFMQDYIDKNRNKLSEEFLRAYELYGGDKSILDEVDFDARNAVEEAAKEAKANEKVHGYKRGDYVVWRGSNGKDEPKTVQIVDFDDYKQPILDAGNGKYGFFEHGDWKHIESADVVSPANSEAKPTKLSGDSKQWKTKADAEQAAVEDIATRIMMSAEMGDKAMTLNDVRKLLAEYDLDNLSATDTQELIERSMTTLTRKVARTHINGFPEKQREGYDKIVKMYNAQPSLNARDSTRVELQQYSTPTPFGYVMGQFMQAGKSINRMLEPSAGNGALTITFDPNVVHVNDIDERRVANLRALKFGEVTTQNGLLPFKDRVDAVATNPPFGTIAAKQYDDGTFTISSLEAQMAINALDSMKDDGRAAIIIGGNTEYRENGSMKPKDASFFGYLYSHYNVADVINLSGKKLYARNGTGYDVRMILIDGRKSGEFQRAYPPVKSKARAEQVTTFDELYNRVQNDILQIQQNGHSTVLSDIAPDRVDGADNQTNSTPSNSGQPGQWGRPISNGGAVRPAELSRTDSTTTGNGGGNVVEPSSERPNRLDNADGGDGASTVVPPTNRTETSSTARSDSGETLGRADAVYADMGGDNPGGKRLSVNLTDEKVAYPNQSKNGVTLMSVVPAAQAQVLQKSLAEIGDVDNFVMQQLGYSSKDELYSKLAAEQIDSVALAINQMNNGNAFIIGDMTGVGKGRQGAALIRYAVRQGKVPVYFTKIPALYSDNYRDLADIGSDNLRPFIMASSKEGEIVAGKGADRKVIYKLPSAKEVDRVFKFINEHGKLPDEYDYILATYSQIQNGTKDYESSENGWHPIDKKLKKNSKGYTAADRNAQMRRDALLSIAGDSYVILDESHTVGGQGGGAKFMQALTGSANGVTFLSATFAKRADNMPIYAQRTAISDCDISQDELIGAIAKGGVTLQEIMSKQLVESGQMIRRERSFEGVNIDWLSVDEETDKRQREQFDEVATIFNDIRSVFP
jgi:predicted RNA methylase